MSTHKPTPASARAKSDAKRAAEIETLTGRLVVAVSFASDNPSDPRVAWAEVATYAGAIQRRSRLLAGLGRGG
jgi:hypothetical protein